MNDRSTRNRRVARAVLALGVLAALVSAGIVRAGDGDVPRAPHGAADMGHQQEVFDRLLGAAKDAPRPADVRADAWAPRVPADNETTPARIALGRRLFFDTALSSDGTVSCATCHDTTRGFTDQRATSEGVKDQLGKRNAPTTLNAAFLDTLFLDGRAASLEAQAKLPLVNPIEMGLKDGDAVVAIVAKDPAYVEMFQKAYGRAPNFDDVGRALAAFERTHVFLRTPFHRFLRGDEAALSPAARRGWELFQGRARCATCHPMNDSMPVGSDGRFHNIGVSARHQDFEALAAKALKALEAGGGSEKVIEELALQTDMGELGRFVVTRNRADLGAFRTSPIVNVALTPPYMHDGSMKTLWDVVDHYNRGGEANPFLDGGVEPLALTDVEVDDMVAFLFALTDERFAADAAKEETRQRELAAKDRPFREPDLANRKILPFEALLRARRK